MPQAIVGLIAAAGIPGLVTASGALTLGGNLLAGAIGFGISYGANALFREDAPKPAEMRGTVRQSVAPRRKSYGEGPMGAAIIFFEVRDGALVQILYLGEGGELGIDAFTEWRLDERIVTVEPDGNINTSPIDGKVEVEFRLGSASQLHYDRVADIFPEIYDATHRCRGCVTVMVKANKVKTEKITEVYPNRLPQLVPVARRNKVFDPRTGLTAYSANLPLIFRSYLIDLDGAGLPASMIDEDDFELAADIGDELLATSGGGTVRRYHGQLDYKLEEEPIDIIERMITATDGRLFLKRSGKIGYRAGKYVAPTVSIPDAVIVSYSLKDSSGPLREGTEVTVRYQNKLARHTEATCDPWIIDTDGTRKPIPIQAYEIQEHHHARRVAKRRAQRATARWRGTIVTDLFGLEAWEEQYIYLEVRDLGIDFEPFEIMDIREGDDDMTVIIDVVSLPEDPETMHDLTFAEEGTPPTIPEDLDDETLTPPQNFAVSMQQRNVGGDTVALLVATWDAYPDRDDLSAQAQISIADEEDWSNITVADNEVRAEAIGLVDGELYDVRVRWLEPDGKPSGWVLFENILAVSNPTPPAGLANFLLTSTVNLGRVQFEIRTGNDRSVRWVNLYRVAAGAPFNVNTATAVNSVPIYVGPSQSYDYLDGDGTRTNAVPNSTFDDSSGFTLLGTGWSVGSGKLNGAAGVASFASQAATFSDGAVVRAALTVSSRTAGAVRMRLQGTAIADGADKTANGTFLETLAVPSGGSTTISIRKDASFVGSLDDWYAYISTPSCAPQGRWDYYAVPFNGSGIDGPASGPITVTIV
ncbi:hypothetical protein [Mycoplana rhizolycopersici]|uniref:Tail protein n=1 Tax=Mycoplana rhizolycopersici TaxID=2746702 RepID=A0ABX2QDY9_9HYPH|nr:hypothetical protein [Rhizobium rhizolycopersici]NVP55958.1 hypothetical protein [Rhizobium rhizolycopersici]